MEAAANGQYKPCLKCNAPIDAQSHFCNYCGGMQAAGDELLTQRKWQLLTQAALFYGLMLMICCVFKFVQAFHTLFCLSVWYVISAGLIGGFIVANYGSVKSSLRLKGVNLGRFAAYCVLAVAASAAVSFSVNWINRLIFPGTTFYDVALSAHHFKYLVFIGFTAVLPALCEEIAFRGYLMEMCLKVADAQQAIIITSFLFALLHLSFLSLYWLFPFAILLGYIRFRTGIIWYGVGIHFFFNLTACLIQIYVR